MACINRFPALVAILILAAGAAAFSAARAGAATYYVDYDDGSDANAGTSPAAPFKRCPGDNAATGIADTTVLAPGDTVIFKGGVYYRSLADAAYLRTVKVAWSGAPGAPITYDGNTAGTFGTGRAIIDGSVRLTGWTACASPADAGGSPHWASIYTTVIPGPVDLTAVQIYENDRLLTMAQDPDINDAFFPDDLDTFRRVEHNIGATTLTDASYFTHDDPNHYVGAYLRMWVTPNVVTRRQITAYDPATSTVTWSGSVTPYDYGYGLYAMANHIDALDGPGEFVVAAAAEPDGGRRIWLWPADGDPNAGEVTFSVRETGIDLVGRDHLVVQGFIVQKHAAGTAQHRDGNAIRTFSGGTDITIRDNVLRWNFSAEKASTLRMYGTGSDDCIDILIEDNEIYENPHNSGMNIDGLRVVVRNNTLRANGGTAIDFYGCRDSQMIGNTVAGHTGVHANGLTLYLSCSNCLVAYNHVTGGMVALTVKESTNITAAYNVLHSVDGNYAVADWGKCDGLYYYNNIMLTDSDDGSALSVGSTTTNVVAKNNIMDGSPVAYRGGVSENNIFTSLMWMQDAGDLGPGEFQATREALFVDPANLDFRLRDSSPAIDAGVAIPGLTRDFAGTPVPQGAAPDAGAFEYVDELAGDCDGDGDVDLDDFVVLKHNFGRTDVTAGPAQGDCDSDGDVDLDDFVILKSNFGTAG